MAATSNVFAAKAGNESVIVHHLPTTSAPSTPVKSKSRTRAAIILLLAILAIVAVSVAVTNNSTSGGQAIPDPPATRSEVFEQEVKAAAVKKDDIPEAAEAPKPAPKAKPPKKQDNMLTMIPTSGLTATVSTEVSSPPTVSDRSDRRNMIQSPTWRG